MTPQQQAEQIMLQRYQRIEQQASETYDNIFYKSPIATVKLPKEKYAPQDYTYKRSTKRVIMYTEDRQETLDYLSSFQRKYCIDYGILNYALKNGTDVFIKEWDCEVKLRYE